MTNDPSSKRGASGAAREPVSASRGDDGSANSGLELGSKGQPLGPGGRPLTWQEEAVLKQDQLFLERMMRKKRGLLEEEEETPKMTDELIKEYYAKQWAGGIKAIFPFLK